MSQQKSPLYIYEPLTGFTKFIKLMFLKNTTIDISTPDLSLAKVQ